MVPFSVLFIAAVVIYLWHQRSREDEALAEYPSALRALDNSKGRGGSNARAVEELQQIADAVFSASAKERAWRSWSPEDRAALRAHLASASSPLPIEEAGMPPGSPRRHFTYNAVMRRLRQVG